MNNIAFWSDWDKPSQVAFKVLSILTLLLVLATLTVELGGLSYFYTWEMTAYLEDVLIPFFSGHSKFIESTIQLNATFLFQKASGTYQLLPNWGVYSFLGVFVLAMAMLCAIVSYLGRFWFIASMGALIMIITGLGIADLGVFWI